MKTSKATWESHIENILVEIRQQIPVVPKLKTILSSFDEVLWSLPNEEEAKKKYIVAWKKYLIVIGLYLVEGLGCSQLEPELDLRKRFAAIKSLVKTMAGFQSFAISAGIAEPPSNSPE